MTTETSVGTLLATTKTSQRCAMKSQKRLDGRCLLQFQQRVAVNTSCRIPPHQRTPFGILQSPLTASFCRINEHLSMHANAMTWNLSCFSHRIFTQQTRVCVYVLALWMIPTNNLSRTHQHYDMAGMFWWAFFTFLCDVLVMSWQRSFYSPALIFLSPPPTWIPSSSSSV